MIHNQQLVNNLLINEREVNEMKENYVIYDADNDVEHVVKMTATQAKAIAWLFDNFDFCGYCIEKASDYEAMEVDD